MAEHFTVEFYADFPNISFDLHFYGRPYSVRMNDGNWELMRKGGVIWLGRGSIHWTEALKRAVDNLENYDAEPS